MNISKKIKAYLHLQLALVGMFFVLLFIFYLMNAFISLELNPAKWEMGIRAMIVSFIALLYAVMTMSNFSIYSKN